MTAIELQPITEENFRAAVKLTTSEAQRDFVANNLYSIAQAYVHPSWQPRLILADGTPVGFVLTGREDDTGNDWIIRFMIDQEHQGKGYGKAALNAIIDGLKHMPDSKEIRLSYVPGNAIAEGLYGAVGFEATGEIDEGEVVMHLTR